MVPVTKTKSIYKKEVHLDSLVWMHFLFCKTPINFTGSFWIPPVKLQGHFSKNPKKVIDPTIIDHLPAFLFLVIKKTVILYSPPR